MILASLKKVNKVKLTATVISVFAVFLFTFFALAQNKNANSIFLDSDQDGLTDQEEKALGTDSLDSDTDGDGYSDGAEVQSGFNPLKPAPGDKLIPEAVGSAPVSSSSVENSAALPSANSQPTDQASTLPEINTLSSDTLSSADVNDLFSDPENPNLTNEMLGNLMQLTVDKSETSSDFTENPTFSATDYNTIVQNALASSTVQKQLPEISDDEIKVLPPIDDKKLSDDEIKSKQKKEIETYLSSVAFIFASNAPFTVNDPNNLTSQIGKETDNLIGALTTGDKNAVDSYAQKTQLGIDQLKKVDVPYILKDVHKSILQLAIYTLDYKEDLVVNPSDPVRSLAALSSLQATSESVLRIQDQLKSIMDQYGITSIELNK